VDQLPFDWSALHADQKPPPSECFVYLLSMASVASLLPSQALSRIVGIPFGAARSGTAFELAAAILALHLEFRPAVFALILGTLLPRSNSRQPGARERCLFLVCRNLSVIPNISKQRLWSVACLVFDFECSLRKFAFSGPISTRFIDVSSWSLHWVSID
jgi:hypothetical protein